VFESVAYDLPLEYKSRSVKQNIKKQMPNTPASKSFDEGTDSTSEAMVWTTMLSTALNLVFQGAMKELIGTILAL